MAEVNTDELVAESHALLDTSLESGGDVGPEDSSGIGAHDDSVMDSDCAPTDDSLNGTSDSVGDTFQAVSFVSKSQKKLYPSDLPPPCTMDAKKVFLFLDFHFQFSKIETFEGFGKSFFLGFEKS